MASKEECRKKTLNKWQAAMYHLDEAKRHLISASDDTDYTASEVRDSHVEIARAHMNAANKLATYWPDVEP